jgi:hypothetical protein
MDDDSGCILASLRQCLLTRGLTKSTRKQQPSTVPETNELRRQQSLGDHPIQLSNLSQESSSKDTVLYLGYGSNLSAETFRGKRQIRPLSQVNVVVPALSLTFDLPGIPYTEPCFGNVRLRDIPTTRTERDITQEDYHKDHWQKGLVGVVYEVTRADYINIIATEGGGSGYQDVLVDCYTLSDDPTKQVPLEPSGQPFKAHTLFAPTKIGRPDHSYAQPSPRYLKLITDGAAEHKLPYEYQDFLNQIRTYHITDTRQQLGQFVFLSVWAPFFLFLLADGAKLFLKPDGTYPKWLATFLRALFTACWASYDNFFKKTFGDGERTIGDIEKDHIQSVIGEEEPLVVWKEKNGGYGTEESIQRLA